MNQVQASPRNILRNTMSISHVLSHGLCTQVSRCVFLHSTPSQPQGNLTLELQPPLENFFCIRFQAQTTSQELIRARCHGIFLQKHDVQGLRTTIYKPQPTPQSPPPLSESHPYHPPRRPAGLHRWHRHLSPYILSFIDGQIHEMPFLELNL